MARTAKLKEVKTKLEAERDRLLDEIANLKKNDLTHAEGYETERPGYGNHLADDATETFEHEKTLALVRNLQDLVSRIERALQKVERGNYGLCDECGLPIDPERLSAIPYANLCIECKAKQERRVR